MTQIKNVSRVVVYNASDHYASQVGAVQLEDEEIIVVFNEASGKDHIDFDSISSVRSKDNGVTWDPSSKSTVWPNSYHFGSDTPSITRLSDGTLLVNFLMVSNFLGVGVREDLGPQSENAVSLRDTEGVFITNSRDGGDTWSQAYKANVVPMRWGQPIDGVVELPNGSILMVVEGTISARPGNPSETIRSFLIRSDDKGKSWEHYSTIAYDPANIINFTEPAICRSNDGVLVCMMRTIHAPRGRHQHLWTAYSENDGESWSRPEATNLWGYPADLILLRDGRMLATYGYRRPPWGLRACVSNDGVSWDIANEFVITEGGVAPKVVRQQLDSNRAISMGWHIGYPTSIQLKNGMIFTVHHEWTQEEPIVQYIVGYLYQLE